MEQQIETINREGLDLNLLKKEGNSKTYPGYLIQKLKESRREGNFDVALLIEHFYKKYLEFQKHEKVKIESWKGKSGINLIEKPDRFICITYQKDDKGEEPKEIKREIMKVDLNDLIVILNFSEQKEKIPTSYIAEKYYKIEWKKVFSDRQKHTYLVLMLNILEKEGKIKYSRKGFTTTIKDLDYFGK